MITNGCGHEKELTILRDIARLAGEWGIAIAELQVAPSPERRKRAADVARGMKTALQAYKQLQGERN